MCVSSLLVESITPGRILSGGEPVLPQHHQVRMQGQGIHGDSAGDDEELKKKSKRNRRSSVGSGAMLNLMQSDAATVEGLALQLHTLWDGLFQVSIYIALLYRYLGAPVIRGLPVLLMTIPINPCPCACSPLSMGGSWRPRTRR